MVFVQREQESCHYRRLRDAVDAIMEVAEGAPGVQCWFPDKPLNKMYLMRGGTHRTRALEFKHRESTAVRNPQFVGWHDSEIFAVSPKDRHRHYVTVAVFWQNWEAHCMLCILLPPMFVYYSSAFGDSVQRFGYLLLETAITEFTFM